MLAVGAPAPWGLLPSCDPQHGCGVIPTARAGWAAGCVPGGGGGGAQNGHGQPPFAGSRRGEAGAGRAAGPKPPDGNTLLLTRCGFRVITPSGLPCFVRSRDGRPPRSLRLAPPWLRPGTVPPVGPVGSRAPFPTRSDCFKPGAARSGAGPQRSYKPPFIWAQNWFVLGSTPPPAPGARKVMEPPTRPSSAPSAAPHRPEQTGMSPMRWVNGAAGVSLCQPWCVSPPHWPVPTVVLPPSQGIGTSPPGVGGS